MTTTAVETDRLAQFYEGLTATLDGIRATLTAAGVDLDGVRARDLYERDLDRVSSR